MKIQIHDTVKRPWGYETLTTIIDDDGMIHNECIFTPDMPDRKLPMGLKIIETKAIAVVQKRKAERLLSEADSLEK